MQPHTGIVLSGGGARGAYEAGVVSGLVEVLGRAPEDAAPFNIFAGTSVGAINAAFLAAHTHRGDMAIDRLTTIWRGLHLPVHLRLDPLRMLGVRRWMARWMDRVHLGTSLLDPAGLEQVVHTGIPWGNLQRNAEAGRLRSLVITALEVASGRTTMFHTTSADCVFSPSKDPRRAAVPGPIHAEHVLASAAIPLVFPARKVGGHWYCDGGLRFNTPIAPAIRSGARRLVVISLMHDKPGHAPPESSYPNPLFLMGKVLNALMLDPMHYDLQVLQRFNRMAEVLEQTLEPAERARVDAVMTQSRGQPYRTVETLVFRPSKDLGELAGEHLRDRDVPEVGRIGGWLLRRAGQHGATWEDDLASYLLFDGAYAEALIELGRGDVLARADEVRAFFDRP
jgi:NTE family protein